MLSKYRESNQKFKFKEPIGYNYFIGNVYDELQQQAGAIGRNQVGKPEHRDFT